ncbi:MAG TPA: FHA domain-containing protein [Phycisphaerales bacterium]|nr:FHA domain-containing protein [Phycisphaerales bacterium]HMP38450.1 FHA domain-containing protein [Phycisphaerales bacterium]
MATLLLSRFDGTVIRRIDLSERRTLSIGRSPRCDLEIPAPSVSRRHAVLFRHAGGWRLTDTGSRRGIECERGALRAVDLDAESWCRIGPAFLWFDPGGAAPPAPRMPDAEESHLLWRPDDAVGPVLSVFGPTGRPIRRVAVAQHEGLVIGSSPECDVAIRDPGLAPIHAVVVSERARWSIVAGDGETALVVDGRQCRRSALHGGLLLAAGAHQVVFSGRILRPAEVSEATQGPESLDALSDTDAPEPRDAGEARGAHDDARSLAHADVEAGERADRERETGQRPPRRRPERPAEGGSIERAVSAFLEDPDPRRSE